MLLAVTIAAWAVLPAGAQTVSGQAFEDRNANGIRDPGEPALPGVQFELFGQRDSGSSIDQLTASGAAGAFSFAPGNGCYLLSPLDPDGWRLAPVREDGFGSSTPGYMFPVGQPRLGKLDHAIDHLKSGALAFASIGDSIAFNFNSCFFPTTFWYSKQVQSRLSCTAPGASVTLVPAAVPGQKTDDLLVDENNDLNNVFRMIDAQPQLVTISMIGNDLRDVDISGTPTQTQINRAAEEILDSRQNLQEALSALTSEIPGADISLNTLYDNLAYNCSTANTTAFHRAWLPIVNRILRDLAWGQTRRASINEVRAEIGHEDLANNCLGFEQMICRDIFGTDGIHPNNNGYSVLREKVWEASGGVNLGPKDALTRTSIGTADYGYLRKLRRLLPAAFELRGGATVAAPSAAFDDQDGGAAAAIGLGIGAEEFRLSRFPDYFDEDQIVRVIAGVRYHTIGNVTDDFYRIEASVSGQFRFPAGHAYTPTDWNVYTPIVGGGGPNQPPSNADYFAEKLLVLPNVASAREVSATLTKNPILLPGATDYEWPAVHQSDLSTTAIRVASAPVAATGGNDAYSVRLDAGWLDIYGWQKPRPPEVENQRVGRLQDGGVEVSFDSLPGAQRYNLYVGRLSTVRSGSYDHGASAPVPALCAAPTQSAGGGRLKILLAPAEVPAGDGYLLVTAHIDDVESPAGARSSGAEIDRSQSVCR